MQKDKQQNRITHREGALHSESVALQDRKRHLSGLLESLREGIDF